MLYTFDEYTLDITHFELRKNGELLHSEPQVIELLAFLVENSGRMVTKEDIHEKIWQGRIVSDAALSSRIKSARQLLGDDGRQQRFIQTVHKRGFRFTAKVDALPVNKEKQTDALAGSEATPSSTPKTAYRSDKPTVMVLPFTNMSAEADQEYICDGVTTDIMAHLARHRWLKVIARNTAFGYKGKSVDIRQLGHELELDYVVEGTLQRAGNRIRIMTHLVDAHSGHQLWSERFDRELTDIFALQDEITEKIAARVEPEIGLAERNRIVHARPSNLQTWDCYHLGIYHFFQFTGEDNVKAQELLKQATQLDEHFAEAYAWWAYAIILGMVYWDTPPTDTLLDQALEACQHALSLDSHNSSFHALKARVLLARREYDAALAENEIAIELNPTFAAAHCGLGDSLAYEGRYQESIDCFERALALSPNDPQMWAFLTYGALAFLFKKEFHTALQWTERARTIPNCQYWTTAHQTVALAYLDRIEEAKRTAGQLQQQNPKFSIAFAREKLFYLKDPQQIELYIQGLKIAGIT